MTAQMKPPTESAVAAGIIRGLQQVIGCQTRKQDARQKYGNIPINVPWNGHAPAVW